MFEDDETIRYVQGDIEVEKVCVGKGRASALPNRGLIASESGGELDMTSTTKLPSVRCSIGTNNFIVAGTFKFPT